LSSRRRPGPTTTDINCTKAINSGALQKGRGVWVPAFAETTTNRYCAIANIPPAMECQACVVLIGRFRIFIATSAMTPIT
jgi:hypothetical protein